ncbi:MAG: hypothetical protein ACREYC_12650 [Gammaproteobacteria bacterium]
MAAFTVSAFHSDRPHRSALPRFATVALTALPLNGIMHGSVHCLSLHYLVAQVTAKLLVVCMWNFAVNGMASNAGGGAALTLR